LLAKKKERKSCYSHRTSSAKCDRSSIFVQRIFVLPIKAIYRFKFRDLKEIYQRQSYKSMYNHEKLKVAPKERLEEGLYYLHFYFTKI